MSSPLNKEIITGMVPPLGAPVRTMDGEHLGTVKEVSGQQFKVDARYSRDYWLSLTLVSDATPECLTVGCDASALDDFKLTGPSTVTSESPVLDAQRETFPTIEDKELRRDRMIHGDSEPR